MHVAAERGHIDAMIWLKDNGADINAKNRNGKTPLDLAKDQLKRIHNDHPLYKEQKKVIEWLKANGAK